MLTHHHRAVHIPKDYTYWGFSKSSETSSWHRWAGWDAADGFRACLFNPIIMQWMVFRCNYTLTYNWKVSEVGYLLTSIWHGVGLYRTMRLKSYEHNWHDDAHFWFALTTTSLESAIGLGVIEYVQACGVIWTERQTNSIASEWCVLLKTIRCVRKPQSAQLRRVSSSSGICGVVVQL